MAGGEFIRGKPRDTGGEKLLSLLARLLTFAIILAGLQMASQAFAKSVNYHPGWAGYPDYKLVLIGREINIYAFYKMFYWTFVYYRRFEIHPYLYGAWKTAGYTSAAAIVFYLFMEFFLIRNIKQNIFDTARWARKKDLKKAGLLQTKGGPPVAFYSLRRCTKRRASALVGAEEDLFITNNTNIKNTFQTTSSCRSCRTMLFCQAGTTNSSSFFIL
jgi:type IV secretory pathway TraG/TraD family ATPase VirD4